MRVQAVIEYDGSRFYGYQSQKGSLPTVASKLIECFESMGIESKPTASGRTDRGVHATAQSIHLDLPEHWHDIDRFLTHANGKLKGYIKIKRVIKRDFDFHARYSAKRRGYRYLIKKKPLNVFESAYLHHVKNFDPQTVSEALKLFEGEHDFVYFMKTGSDTKSSVRKIHSARLYEYRDLWVIYLEANGFLRSQVRLMCGALFELKGKESIEKIKEQLKGKKRHFAKPAPPNALYLCRVVY